MNYLDYLSPSVNRPEIEAAHHKLQNWVNQEKKGFLRYREPYFALSKYKAGRVQCSGDIVTIGSAEEVSAEQQQEIREHLRSFMPWRKGPFSVFGIDIDAEWRSERKWARLAPHLPDMKDMVIADVGCNNGYYMFRMMADSPRFVLGMEPSVQHYYCFKALNEMAGFRNQDIDLLGVEHISLFPETFDMIFLMGIIYHRPSPIDVLKDLFTALKPGGTLVMETQAIPGNDPVALFPDKTYAKVPGTYFVPTPVCVTNWMQRSGYVDVSMVDATPMSSQEQRKTAWMEFESYEDFIDPENPQLTLEGYPAPLRTIHLGRKKN